MRTITGHFPRQICLLRRLLTSTLAYLQRVKWSAILSPVAFAVLASVGGMARAQSATVADLVCPPVIYSDHSDQSLQTKDALRTIQARIESELKRSGANNIAIALFSEDAVLWQAQFETVDHCLKAKPVDRAQWRVGSISKLVTALAVIALVDQQRVQMDAPVETYLPDFAPARGRPGTMTVRHLLSHRAGLVREPPIGHFADPSGAPLSEVVSSLNHVGTVAEPGARYHYSNAGYAVLGRIIEEASGQSFAAAVKTLVLNPAAMEHAQFDAAADVPRMAGTLSSYDDLPRPAPAHPIGAASAADLAASLSDLVALGQYLMGSDRAVRLATEGPSPDADYAAGIMRRQLDGDLMLGHSGSIYGFTSDLRILPDRNLGVVVVADRNFVAASRLSQEALRAIRSARDERGIPDEEPSAPAGLAASLALEGKWRSPDALVYLRQHINSDGQAQVFVEGLEQVGELRRTGDDWSFISSNVIEPMVMANDWRSFTLNAQRFELQANERPPAPHPQIAELISHYAFGTEYVRLYEWDGRLHARLTWNQHVPLEPIAGDVYRFTSGGYQGEELAIRRNDRGNVIGLEISGVAYRRVDFGAEFEAMLRSLAQADAALIDRARATIPPAFVVREAGRLSDVRRLDATIRARLAYATKDNFLGLPVYRPQARPLLQPAAAQAVAKLAESLKAEGYGLLVHDAYRPWWVTWLFWEAMPSEGREFVADPAEGSRHNRGAAIDLTLYDLRTGLAVEMPGRLDEVSMRSHFAFVGGTDRQRWYRDLLRRTMRAHGFSVYEPEWWHYDFKDWQSYPVSNQDVDRAGP